MKRNQDEGNIENNETLFWGRVTSINKVSNPYIRS
jgi:hypothetical protein